MRPRLTICPLELNPRFSSRFVEYINTEANRAMDGVPTLIRRGIVDANAHTTVLKASADTAPENNNTHGKRDQDARERPHGRTYRLAGNHSNTNRTTWR